MLDTDSKVGALDWDFKGCDTQYGVHGIHTYVAAMIPQLARGLIDHYALPDGPVFGPFCGGGAVLAEAVLSGRAAIGRDVNELAVLISRAKTTRISESDSTAALERILAKTDRSLQPPLVDSGLAYWFKPRTSSSVGFTGGTQLPPPNPPTVQRCLCT